MKQLYFLHIPKTAGKYISKNIKKSLDNYNINSYISTSYPNDISFQKASYISMHAGTYPIIKNPTLDVATIIRNPIDARVSYFNFVYNRFLHNRKEYAEIDSVYEKLKFYLFEDENMESHNNFQSRFLCNPADEKSFNISQFYLKNGLEMMKPFMENKKAFDWFVKDHNTSEENLFLFLNRFKIVNTLDNIDMFINSIQEWFLENYGIAVEFDKEERVNESLTKYGNDIELSTKDLLSMLTEEDKVKILEKNWLDQKAYLFIKENEKNVN